MKEEISYDDFAKIDLRIAKIESAEAVPQSEKLVKLQVDLGAEGKRQIVAGIGKNHAPEELVGKTIVVVANLAPRRLMGEESQGMLLAASDGELPILLTTERDTEAGTGIR